MSSILHSLLSIVRELLPWAAYLLLLIALAAGLFINILGLPGLWLIVIAAALYGWGFGFAYVGWWTIGVLVALGVLAELIEFFAGAAGSKRAGGSKRGMAGAIVGGIVGGIAGTPLIPVPILGTIIGSVVGAFVGAYLVEWMIGRSHGQAAAISYGAAKGKVFGLVAKTSVGIAMVMFAALAAIPISCSAAKPLAPMNVTPATALTPR